MRLVRSRWLVGSRWLSGSRSGFPQLFGSKPSFRVGSGFGEQVGGHVVRFGTEGIPWYTMWVADHPLAQ